MGQEHHLFLIHTQAVGVAQHLRHVGMLVGDQLPAVLAVGVVVVHVGGHGPGPVEGIEGADILELGGGQGPHQVAHRPAFELEDPDGVPPLQHLVGQLVVKGDPVDVGSLAGGGFDEVEGPLDDRQVAQPQEIHLEQAEVLDPMHLVLGDDRGVLDPTAGLGLALDGKVLGQRLAGNDHRGGMDAVLTAQALQPPGHVDHLGRRRGRSTHIWRSSRAAL